MKIPRPTILRAAIPALCTAGFFGFTASGHAQITDYTGPTPGEWGTAANWSNGVPNAIDATANVTTAVTINVSDTGTAGTYPYTFGALNFTAVTGTTVIGDSLVATDILTAAVTAGSPTVSVSNAASSLFFYQNLLGNQGFTKTGSGRLTFRFNPEDQTYSGPIVISGGLLGIEKNSSLGDDANDITIANLAKLAAEPGSNSGTITLPSSRTITLTGTNSQIGANNAAVNLIIQGAVNEDAPGKGLEKTEPGEVTLAGTIGYTGDTRIAAGTLSLSPTAILPAAANLRFSAANVATLNLAGTSQTVRTLLMDTTTTSRTITGGGSLTINGGVNFLIEGGNAVTYDFSGTDAFTINSPANSAAIRTVNTAGVITMDVNFAKSGASGGVNTITGTLFQVGGAGASAANNGTTARAHLGTQNTINADTINLGAFNAAGTLDFQSDLGADPFLKIRGTNGVNAAVILKVGETSSGARSGQGVLNLTGGRLDAIAATVSVGRHIANAATAETSTLTMPAGSLIATNIILSEKVNNGTPTITGTINQDGGTVTASVLTFGKGGGQAAVLRPIYNLNGGTLFATTINALGGAFNATTSARTLNIGAATLSNAPVTDLAISGFDLTAGGRLNINLTDAAIFQADAGQTITVASTVAIGGFGSLTKTGDGALILSGAQNYPALTTSGGTTTVNGSFTGGIAMITANAETTFTSNQEIGSLTIGPGAVVTLSASAGPAPEFGGEAIAFANAPQAVPEPGTALSLLSGVGFLLASRRAKKRA